MSARSYVLSKRRQGNITVEKKDDNIEVYLHGNLVVRHNTLSDELYISTCGWATPTTRTAINRYFDLTSTNAGVYQSKHEQFLNYGQEMVSLCENGNNFTFYPNTKVIVNTKIAKKMNKNNIVNETEGHLTVRL